MKKLELLHFVPVALIVIGLILSWSATTYFNSPTSGSPKVPPSSSSMTCHPINNGLNKACSINISINLGISASFSGAVTSGARYSEGELLKSIGHLMELYGVIGLLFIGFFRLFRKLDVAVFGLRLPILLP